ncbi:MAG: NUDIX hydrolase [Firmicutes bacterium]|nr:NUDIX hydrolase [Bacillota bacterium]
MKKPEIKKEWVKPLLNTRFLNVYDLNPNNSRKYFDASRRSLEDLVAVKSEEEFKNMLPDAVSIVLILENDGEEKLLLTHEYRYATGQELLSVPAGLIDAADKEKEAPLFETAIREVFEETGLQFKEGDEVSLVNPLLFSTPGMSDESNGIVKVKLHNPDLSTISADHSEGGEIFTGFDLLSKEEAKRILNQGMDDAGIFYSVYTWIGLATFLLEL